MQYLLTEEEYLDYLQMKGIVHAKVVANKALEEEVENLKRSREEDRNAILANRERRRDLRARLESTQAQLKITQESLTLSKKKIAEQAHELLVKEGELADLSSKLLEATQDCKTAQNVCAERFDLINNLSREVHQLKSERVCIANFPPTGAVKVISVVKADTYRTHGWIVSEEYLVDRPALTGPPPTFSFPGEGSKEGDRLPPPTARSTPTNLSLCRATRGGVHYVHPYIFSTFSGLLSTNILLDPTNSSLGFRSPTHPEPPPISRCTADCPGTA